MADRSGRSRSGVVREREIRSGMVFVAFMGYRKMICVWDGDI